MIKAVIVGVAMELGILEGFDKFEEGPALVRMNDREGLTFPEIADRIESEV
jgi:hypothetical protein